MRIEGKVTPPKGRKNRFWGVEIPLLEVYTQGKSREDAYRMARDAIESLVNKKGFSVTITPAKRNLFEVSSDDFATFLAFVLTRLRTSHHLSAREVSERLSSSSPNAYVRYERGKAMPKLNTLLQLLRAIDPRLSLVLKGA
ncbi:MAG: type II toxin-antitoxin system HicB family antitoxin [Pseudomonadota bacterium]